MSVTELMDEYGKIINDRVKVGDELIEIDGQHVKNLPVGDVIRSVSGAPGTIVTLRFLDEGKNRVYDIKALRHVPIGRTPAGSGSAGPTRSPPRVLASGNGSAGPQLTSVPARSPATGSGSAGPPPAATIPNLMTGPAVPVNRLASGPSARSPPPAGARGNPVSNQASPASPRAELV